MALSYPQFWLTTTTNGETITRRTKKKKSFLLKVDALKHVDGLVTAKFTIKYGPDASNESIDYSHETLKEMARVARIFTSKDEIEWMMKEAGN